MPPVPPDPSPTLPQKIRSRLCGLPDPHPLPEAQDRVPRRRLRIITEQPRPPEAHDRVGIPEKLTVHCPSDEPVIPRGVSQFAQGNDAALSAHRS